MNTLKEQIRWILAYCPSTGDEVVGSGWGELFATTGGQATWWQCPSCGGWHLAMSVSPSKPQLCTEQSTMVC